MKKRLLAGLLALVMLLGVLAGCSKKGSDTATPGSTDAVTPSGGKPTAQTTLKYGWKIDTVDLDLDEGISYMSSALLSTDALYFTSDIMTDPGSGDDFLEYSESEQYAREAAAVAADAPADQVADVLEDAAAADEVSDTPVAEEPMPDREYIPPTYETRLFKIDLATGKSEHLEWFKAPTVPDGYEGWTNITLLRVEDDGSLWVADRTGTYKYDLPENFDPNTQNQYDYYVQGPTTRHLFHYAADGTVIHEVPLPAETTEGDGSSMDIMLVDELGQVYLTDYTTVTIMDADGKTLKTLEADGNSSPMAFCGKFAMQSWGENAQTMRILDPKTLELGDAITMPYNAWNYYASYDPAFDFYYMNAGVLYGYRTQEQQSEKVLDWMDYDIDFDTVNQTEPLADGRILGILQTYNDDYTQTSYSLLLCSPVDPATLQQRKTLSIACLYMDYDLRQEILKFNKSQQDVRITINDYSQYMDENGYQSALTKLNTEILSGKVPDLFMTNGLPIEQYAAQGILVDLKPMLDSDPELSYDQLMTNVVDAASVDGKLYQAFSEFSIVTVVALGKVADNFQSWTLADVHSAMDMLQPGATVFGTGYTRDNVLQSCVGNSMAKFVDWDTGKCSFDSQEFKDLLAFANEFPETFDWQNYDYSSEPDSYTAMRNGLQLMLPTSVYTLEDHLWMLAALNADASFVGYPSQDGSGSTFVLTGGVAISSACREQDAAWSFVRKLFTADYQRNRMYYGLPSNAAVFNERLKDVMTVSYQTDENGQPLLDENGEKIIEPKATYWGNDGEQYTIDVMTQAQADQVMALYNSIHKLNGSNDAIYNIVTEEAGAYFAGQRSLDDVAAIIQNRVGLYVAEQK